MDPELIWMYLHLHLHQRLVGLGALAAARSAAVQADPRTVLVQAQT